VALDVERVVLGLCPGLAPFCKLVTPAKVGKSLRVVPSSGMLETV
jgi:hypothetical protein